MHLGISLEGGAALPLSTFDCLKSPDTTQLIVTLLYILTFVFQAKKPMSPYYSSTMCLKNFLKFLNHIKYFILPLNL